MPDPIGAGTATVVHATLIATGVTLPILATARRGAPSGGLWRGRPVPGARA